MLEEVGGLGVKVRGVVVYLDFIKLFILIFFSICCG